jgi:alpha,alpha-trehalase
MTSEGDHGYSTDEFTLVYDGFARDEEGLREALTSTGNGYFCLRGAAEWEDADDVHYPGTYAHGVYNRESTIVAGRPIPNEDLVNLPRCLSLKLSLDGEEPIRLENVQLLSYRHSYDVRYAMVSRELRFKDRAGRETRLRSRRFVSMGRMHLAALESTVVAENWSGRLELISALDGRVLNRGVARYERLWGRHLDPEGPRIHAPDVIALKVRTRQSRIEIAEAARTRVYRGEDEAPVERHTYQIEDYIQQTLSLDVQQGEPVRAEKMVALYTSRDRGINEPLVNAGKSATRYPTFDQALEGHQHAWRELWEVCDIRLPHEPRVQFLLRLHIAHLLQTCSRLTPHHDAGVPARGLNGEAYRGHVFWDELYVYPFLTYRLPEITRGLLMYRYRRIGEARASAEQAGYRGAMYPWQSGSDGEEETQVVHINPLSGLWEVDLSHNQRHVNAAIFYNVWHYFQVTHDIEFLREHGAEMMIEIARFWCSIAHYNPDRDRYEIHGVMGPDEFHEKYPGAVAGGLHNNAYTNVLVAWICRIAPQALDLLPASRREVLRARTGVTDEELARWQDMTHKMFVPFHGDGIISQFEGYEGLEELDWDAYRRRYGNIQRLDRILRAEGDSTDRYKVSKQADAVMLFFLFSHRELEELFTDLGYEYSEDVARRTIDYYDRRTSHGSSLSHVTYARVLAGIDPESSWQRFLSALQSDIEDTQGGTTKEGIHLGVMAGTLDLLQRAYLGIEIVDDVIYFKPTAIDRLDGLRLPLQVRRSPIVVTVNGQRLTVSVLANGHPQAVIISVNGIVREVRGGDSTTFELRSRPAPRTRVPRRPSAGFEGAIFGGEGVLVDSPHELAWRETLHELMESSWSGIRTKSTWSRDGFTTAVYQDLVAGQPRRSGALAVLHYFEVPDAGAHVEQYASLTQQKLAQLIEAGEFTVFPDAVRLLLDVRAAGIRVAATSWSKNGRAMLGRLGLDTLARDIGRAHDLAPASRTLLDLVDADISGRTLARGKPDPKILLTACRELELAPESCFVVADAASGITAAKAANMAALGIARLDDGELLREAGADLVVTSLDDVDRAVLAVRRLAALARPLAAHQ